MKKPTISMAFVALVLQAGGISSAADVIVYDPALPPVLPFTQYPPGGYATLASSLSYISSGVEYAGVFQGLVDSAPAAFFCGEINHDVAFSTTTSLTPLLIVESNFDGLALHDGSSGSVKLSQKQFCLLVVVYDYLKVDNPFEYTGGPTTSQDLTGTSTAGVGGVETMSELGDLKATAAQLVMWEIIHEPAARTATEYNSSDPSVNAVSLSYGALQWTSFKDATNGALFDPTVFANEFNAIASSAYSFCPVPEVTSPVALIAGLLLFVRRREPRACSV
jgi:hypothetical protein